MKLALLQMRAEPGDVGGNLVRIENGLREAAARGADLLVAPELAIPGYGAAGQMAALAEPADGPSVTRLSALAAESGVAIVAGFAERADDTVWNSAVFTDGRRAPVVYRKTHLYGDYERSLFQPGPKEAVTFDHAGMKLGLLICYDVEFPENVRRLALAGVEAAIVPTALPASPNDDFFARQMIPVRAFENQFFVAYCDLCGSDERFAYAGLSTVAAPDGSLLATAGRDEALLIVELSPEDFAASAARNTYFQDLAR